MSARTQAFRKALFGTVAILAISGAVLPGVALAQRDPAYAAARANGEVGEKMDGYLGLVDEAGASPALVALVKNLNMQRKEIYFQQAQEEHVTPQEYGISAGCKQIARTVPGERYQAPDGSWKVRTAAPPVLHSKCP